MTAIARQNTLFVSEDWVRIYEALENVDFRAYDADNLTRALMNYLRANYPEEYNDWIASSEFVTKVEILAWLSQNIAFRTDLNTRENLLATAERRISLIRLAENIAYKINRVRSATGTVKIESVRTNRNVIDSNGVNLRDTTIRWNDPRDEDWFERFIAIMNTAFTTRTQFGRPVNSYRVSSRRRDQYLLNSIAPLNGTYSVTGNVNGTQLPFDVHNHELNSDNGLIEEIAPGTDNIFSILYQLDGQGFGSVGSGFFLPIKQGNLSYQDEVFQNSVVFRTVDLGAQNINNDDFFVQRVDDEGNVLENWERVDTIFGEGVSFNTVESGNRAVYELQTLENDRVRVVFGDGSFGRIPSGRFRFWFRTANPQPLVVRPNSIQNQTISIPYVRDNQLSYLTLTFSLQESLSNAASSETNDDIRTRANKVFYTQNRMITGRDYNEFYLKDNSIQKVKTVNRTYAGHSRYSRLNDPTGLYQNVKHIAEDGRLYQDDTRTVNFVTANTDLLSNEQLVNDHIKPLIRKEDKRLLYYNRYTEIVFTRDFRWNETSVVSGQSRGNIVNGSTPQIVGDSAPATSSLRFIDSGALLRLDDLKGPFAFVDRVIEDGNAPDGVILREDIEDGIKIVSVFPPIRNRFTPQEALDIEDVLDQRLDFGLSWNLQTESWDIITFDNLDKTSSFDLTNQGDITGSQLDASWLIMLEYVPGGDEEDEWQITDRGLGLFFESAREIDFIFANNEPIVDPETGRTVQDEITLLASNESRDSLRRRGLEPFGDLLCDQNAYTFLGDGVTTCFRTSENPLNEERIVVTIDGELQVVNIDFTIQRSVQGDSVCFFTAPPANSVIEIRLSNRFRNARISALSFTGDGTQGEYELDQEILAVANTVASQDGVLQYSSVDFGVGQIGFNASIIFNDVLPTDVVANVYMYGNIDNTALTKTLANGNGSQTIFAIPTRNQTSDTVLVSIDGVVQAPSRYTVNQTSSGSEIIFNDSPGDGTAVRVVSITRPELAKTRHYEFNPNGVTNSFTLTGLNRIQPENVMVFFDGVMQQGPWGPNPVWNITGTNQVIFNSAPLDDINMSVFVIAGLVGTYSGDDDDIDFTADNLGDISTSSCLVNYLGRDLGLTPVDVIRHADGYVNKNGLFVAPIDADLSGFYDEPLLFRSLVLQDGFTDLVLWRGVEEFGFEVWQPISQLTSPKGTYGLSTQGDPQNGSSFDPEEVSDGDIHYDIATNTWLIADGVNDVWVAATDQSDFRFRVGRDHLRFQWTHYAPEAHRIDPAIGNIMNAYILPATYDTAYRVWLSNNGPLNEEPVAPTSEQLRIQYQEFEQFKAMSDAIIYYPARYKPLFGDQAVQELRAIFKVVKTPGSRVSDSDLKLRVLNVIDEYFDVDRWDFGEKFFFTELCAFLHARLAPDVQSVVIVPRDNDQAFGRLFQVRSEPDELFISAASPEDVEIVTNLSDDELRIGSFV